MDQDRPRSGTNGSYRVGAVAALTGLPAGTIRTWERRYAAVTPGRSAGGGRRYSDDDVERLVLLRELTDAGFAIGELAPLPTDALQERARRRGAQPLTIGVADHPMLRPLCDANPTWSYHLIPDEEVLKNFQGDVLVVDLATLGEHPVESARELRRQTRAHLFVRVEFATAKVVDALRHASVWVLQGPHVDPGDFQRLVRLVAGRVPAPSRRASAPRRLDDDALARLMAIESPIQCECPQHLAKLVASLDAFERYSRQCESRSPDDAALHQRLAEGTGRARQSMEELLVAVCEAEGIALDDTAATSDRDARRT